MLIPMKKRFFAICYFFAAILGVCRAAEITLQTYNGSWLTAEGGGGQGVYGYGGGPGAWETFTLSDLNGGSLENGDPITIQASSGHYFCAEGGGGQNVVANRTWVGGWEVFYIHKLNGGGAIESGTPVAIQAGNGQFVCAEGGGGGDINANRDAINGWEMFTMTINTGGSSGGGTPVVSITPSASSVQVGETVYFSVSASSSGGLSELGLEGCDGSGNPVSNLGAAGVGGASASYSFAWHATAAGTYLFDAYAWNTDRSQLTRTGAITILVSGSTVPTVTISPSSTTIQVGQTIQFSVGANCSAGLSEVGLEACDGSGTALANLGATGVSGSDTTQTFTWTASSAGTFYFDAYAWNGSRSHLTRTGVVSVTVADGAGSSGGDILLSSLGPVGDVILHVGEPPVVSVNASSTAISAGQGVTFTVSATAGTGLSELGLELCDAEGNPLSAVGAVGVTGDSANHSFSWSTPMLPNAVGSENYAFWRSARDTYYFVAYAWNKDCSMRTRTGVISVKLKLEENTQFEGWVASPGATLSETYWYAFDPRTEGGISFIGNIPDVPAPTSNARAEFEAIIAELDAAENERIAQLNAEIGAAETARVDQQISEALARGNGYRLVNQFGQEVRKVPPTGGGGWTMRTVYHVQGTLPPDGDVVMLPAFVVNGNDLSNFDWNAYTSWFSQNGLQAIHPAGIAAAAAGTPADNVASAGTTYQKSQLNAQWSMSAVYDILGKTPKGQALAEKLARVKIYTYTSVDAIAYDRQTGQSKGKVVMAASGVTLQGVIYLSPKLSNRAAVEVLFHEYEHVAGLPATPANEIAIRVRQTQFMIDIGLDAIIANAVVPPASNPNAAPTVDPDAVKKSLPPGYYDLEYRPDPSGKMHGVTPVQIPTP